MSIPSSRSNASPACSRSAAGDSGTTSSTTSAPVDVGIRGELMSSTWSSPELITASSSGTQLKTVLIVPRFGAFAASNAFSGVLLVVRWSAGIRAVWIWLWNLFTWFVRGAQSLVPPACSGCAFAAPSPLCLPLRWSSRILSMLVVWCGAAPAACSSSSFRRFAKGHCAESSTSISSASSSLRPTSSLLGDVVVSAVPLLVRPGVQWTTGSRRWFTTCCGPTSRPPPPPFNVPFKLQRKVSCSYRCFRCSSTSVTFCRGR
mmetsp:Transcript_27048/g.68173  ORF Transcript_27048/g.68173 Transcript_27048/m.68173 type:complete len:260 (+) Transcript_27048:547-1326(+)